MLKGKKLSILGDSISTYKGVSDDPKANSTLIYNPYYYSESRFPIEKTYWMQVMKELGLTLCVNNSWSGGNLSFRDDETSGICRAHHLSRDDGECPDIIIVFIGTNDLGRVNTVPYETFAEDYAQTLRIIKNKYPLAYVCCVNLADKDLPRLNERLKMFNSAIEAAVEAAGARFFIADQFHSQLCGEDYYNNTIDGLHPDEDGMRILAETVCEAIRKNCCNR